MSRNAFNQLAREEAEASDLRDIAREERKMGFATCAQRVLALREERKKKEHREAMIASGLWAEDYQP